MNEKLSVFLGVQINFSQAIQDKADQVVNIFKATRGSTDMAAEQQAGLAQVVIRIDRARIDR